jgi:acetyltransferase-like isoleucine patch superfamily enzyme
LRPFSAIGGVKSIIQSHELDLVHNKTEPGRVVLDKNAVTSTGCILLKDSCLPERSVLAAGAVLRKAKEGENMPTSSLYGGAPARFIREIKRSEFWDRTDIDTPPAPFDDAKFRLD